MYSGKNQVYENEYEDGSSMKPGQRRPCNTKCALRGFHVIAALAMLAMIAYLVYNSEPYRGGSRDDVTRELSLLREELHAVKTEFEKISNMPHQADKIEELISKMTSMTQRLDDLSQLNQKITKITEGQAEMRNTLSSVSDKLDGIETVNQNLQAQSREMGGMKGKLEGVHSETNVIAESIRDMKGDIMNMRNQLQGIANGSRSSFAPSGMIHICWIVVLYFLFKN